MISNSQALLSSQSLDATQRWNLDLPKECYYNSLFVSKFNTGPVGVSTPFSWLHHGLLAYSGNGTISDRFAQNLTQAFFGHYFAQRKVMNAAQAEYGRNLLILKSSLDVPEMIASEDLFRAILTAVIFELVTQTSPYAWLMHTFALARIIQTGHAIMHRKRTFFESPEWRLAGSQDLPSDLLNQLADMHIRVPGLLEDFDKLCSSDVPPAATFSTLSHLQNRIVDLLNSLITWRWEWERQHSDQVWAIPLPPSSQIPRDATTDEPIYPTLFEFSSVVRMGEMCRYNGILAILLILLRHICSDDTAYINLLDLSTPVDLLHRTHRSPLCLPSDSDFSPRNAAAEHIRSVEKALDQEIHVSSTGLIIVLMLNLTYKALPAGDTLRSWIKRIYLHSSSAQGTREMIRDYSGRIPYPASWKRFYLPPEVEKEKTWERATKFN
ncbi:MAG: hypothetical protein Q9180_005871 [Flavoplaca navasiana]